MSLYENPYYYEVAFSYRDISKEVNFFEQCIKQYSKINVKEVIEIGCGPSPYMLELINRKYFFTGLDNSKVMLDYAIEKAKKEGITIKTIHADMRDFKTVYKVDFAFCMLGSLALQSNEAYTSHLNSIAKCLKQGGLYLIDGFPCTTWPALGKEEWTIKKKGLTIEVKWEETPLNIDKRMVLETITLKIREDGETKIIKEESKFKSILLNDFLELVNKSEELDFIDRFNNFDLNQPLEQAIKINRPITILRKK